MSRDFDFDDEPAVDATCPPARKKGRRVVVSDVDSDGEEGRPSRDGTPQAAQSRPTHRHESTTDGSGSPPHWPPPPISSRLVDLDPSRAPPMPAPPGRPTGRGDKSARAGGARAVGQARTFRLCDSHEKVLLQPLPPTLTKSPSTATPDLAIPTATSKDSAAHSGLVLTPHGLRFKLPPAATDLRAGAAMFSRMLSCDLSCARWDAERQRHKWTQRRVELEMAAPGSGLPASRPHPASPPPPCAAACTEGPAGADPSTARLAANAPGVGNCGITAAGADGPDPPLDSPPRPSWTEEMG